MADKLGFVHEVVRGSGTSTAASESRVRSALSCAPFRFRGADDPIVRSVRRHRPRREEVGNTMGAELLTEERHHRLAWRDMEAARGGPQRKSLSY